MLYGPRSKAPLLDPQGHRVRRTRHIAVAARDATIASSAVDLSCHALCRPVFIARAPCLTMMLPHTLVLAIARTTTRFRSAFRRARWSAVPLFHLVPGTPASKRHGEVRRSATSILLLVAAPCSHPYACKTRPRVARDGTRWSVRSSSLSTPNLTEHRAGRCVGNAAAICARIPTFCPCSTHAHLIAHASASWCG